MSIKSYRFDGGKNLRLQEQPTGAGEQKQQKAELKAKTAENLRKAALLAEKLYAAGTEGLVIAIQARDAAGKDSLIKHVFSALNPQAMEVHAFKTPTSQELSHDYLWRIVQALPPRGKVGILNRSHYEDVLVVKVHHLEKTYRMAPRCLGDDFFEKRYRQLRHFEEYLYENSYRVVKLFLNVSREEQIRRIAARDGLGAQAAAARIDSQMPLEEKMRRADRCIDASGSIEETQRKIQQLWEELA